MFNRLRLKSEIFFEENKAFRQLTDDVRIAYAFLPIDRVFLDEADAQIVLRAELVEAENEFKTKMALVDARKLILDLGLENL